MFGYMWLRMILGTTKLDVGDDANRSFMNKKIATGKFFFNQILSESEFLLKNIKKIDVTLLKDVVSDGIT